MSESAGEWTVGANTFTYVWSSDGREQMWMELELNRLGWWAL